MKKIMATLLACLSFSVFAEMPDLMAPTASEGLSQECVHSLRDLYRFYFYQIQPNPKYAAQMANEKLSSKDTLEMQVVIGELKKHCSNSVVAQVNESLKTTQQESA